MLKFGRQRCKACNFTLAEALSSEWWPQQADACCCCFKPVCSPLTIKHLVIDLQFANTYPTGSCELCHALHWGKNPWIQDSREEPGRRRELLKTLSRALMWTYLSLRKFIDSSVENGLGEGWKARQFRKYFAGPSRNHKGLTNTFSWQNFRST